MNYQIDLILRIYNQDRSCCLRGETTIELPFSPSIGMEIKIKDMLPIKFEEVIWLAEERKFRCVVVDESYKFDLKTDINELSEDLDILIETKKSGWSGFNKIYRCK